MYIVVFVCVVAVGHGLLRLRSSRVLDQTCLDQSGRGAVPRKGHSVLLRPQKKKKK